MSLRAGDRIGGYEVRCAIGAGAMGEVYRAHDHRLHRDVALKVLPSAFRHDPDRVARFEREARALAALNHPNIAALYGIAEDGGQLALVMELVDGEPLSTRLGASGLPLRDALKIAVQVAAALEAAHRVGVVHRDLKPTNVLVGATASVKVIDFGIAKLIDAPADALVTQTSGDILSTLPHHVLGTAAYMSPEQARGEPVDARSDIFSFGTLFYEMLTGRRPFAGNDIVTTLAAILESTPPPPSAVAARPLPREVERVAMRCLRKDRDRRIQSASDLKLELEDLLEDTSTAHAPGAPAPDRRRLVALAIAGAIAAAVVVGVVLATGALRTTSPPPAFALRQLTFEAGVALTPALSPDGKLLAYASDRSGEAQLDIWLKQIPSGEPVRLTTGPETKVNPQFSGDGTRIYFLGGRASIYEIPTLGGPMRRIVDVAGPFAVSTRGDLIFHRPGTATTPGPMFVLRVGASMVEPWHPECVSSGSPTWSPDGAQVAFIGDCTPNPEPTLRRGYVLVAPLNGGSITRIGTVRVTAVAPRVAWTKLADGHDAWLIPVQSGDATNLHRLTFDGTVTSVTQGTGLEVWPAPTSGPAVAFSRIEQTPVISSIPLIGQQVRTKEASPARLFAVTPDESKLVFGRMLGFEQGQLVLRDRARGAEVVLASHRGMRLEGSGSLWPQLSRDGRRVAYRINTASGVEIYVVSTEGGTPRFLRASQRVSLPSDWTTDGTTIIGECRPVGAICELVPQSDEARVVLEDPRGGELLYPSFSWDGSWMAFMRRRSGETRIVLAPIGDHGRPGSESQWVTVSPEGDDAGRPRFGRDDASVYYTLNRGNVVTLVRQQLHVSTKHPVGAAQVITGIQNIPTSVVNLGIQNLIAVTRDHVFFNHAEIRSNIWMTSAQ